MSYDRNTAGSGPLTPGFDGDIINLTGGDFAVPDSVKAIVITGPGDVVCRPLGAVADIPLTDLPSGYILPWHCSHVRQSGTTAALATVAG